MERPTCAVCGIWATHYHFPELPEKDRLYVCEVHYPEHAGEPAIPLETSDG